MILELLFLGGRLGKEKLAEACAKATVARWNQELTSMPVWGGVEKQIKEYQKFYNKPWDWYKCPVRFGGDPNKWRSISLRDVAQNRQYWDTLKRKNY